MHRYYPGNIICQYRPGKNQWFRCWRFASTRSRSLLTVNHMKALWITKHGGPDVLSVRESADPSPEPKSVRVRVRAAGLNFAEVMARKGLYPDAPKPPCVVGYEGSGVIDAVGSEVRDLSVGQRVLFLSHFGAHADVVCVPAESAMAIPDRMSFEEAAALPVNYLTAYHMMFHVTRVRAGDHLLIHMAAGGVGTAMLQLAQSVPGLVTYGTCSESKHAFAKSHGLMHAIDYRSVDYVREIKRLTAERGVDYVYDALGGLDWKKGYSMLRPGGMVVAFGFANASKGERRNLWAVLVQLLRSPWVSPITLMNGNKGYAGVNMGHLWHEIALLRGELEAIMQLYDQGVVRPHVSASVPFSRAKEAFAMLEQGKNMGKVLLIPD